MLFYLHNGNLKYWNYCSIVKCIRTPELSLTQHAKQLQTNPSVVFRVINQGFQFNFNDFINQYRIEAIM